jgi:hypothetical protein
VHYSEGAGEWSPIFGTQKLRCSRGTGAFFRFFLLQVVPPSYSEARLHLLICFRWKRTITFAELSPGEPFSRGSFLATASVGALYLYDVARKLQRAARWLCYLAST